MSKVVQEIKTCTKCQKVYVEIAFAALPNGPDVVFGAKGEWPTCQNVVNGEVCGHTDFAPSDDSDDDE